MRRPLLSIFAVISLIGLGVFACGYVAQFGPTFQHNVFDGAAPHSTVVRMNLEFGRIRVLLSHNYNRPLRGVPAFYLGWESPRFGLPDGRRSIWEFDAHYLTITTNGWTFLVAFPIWIPVVPLFIAPLLWLGKRRKPQLAAFPVIVGADDSGAAKS